MSTVHTLIDGESKDIELQELFPEGQSSSLTLDGAGLLEATSAAAAMVKEAIADYLDRPLRDFEDYEVILEKNGNVSVRPAANFGNA